MLVEITANEAEEDILENIAAIQQQLMSGLISKNEALSKLQDIENDFITCKFL